MVVMNKTVKLLGAVSMLAFLGAGMLRQYYTRSMPETPQIQQGRTIPIDANYGKTVYVTLERKESLKLLMLRPALWQLLSSALHSGMLKENS